VLEITVQNAYCVGGSSAIHRSLTSHLVTKPYLFYEAASEMEKVIAKVNNKRI
jgi:hypothetical protein